VIREHVAGDWERREKRNMRGRLKEDKRNKENRINKVINVSLTHGSKFILALNLLILYFVWWCRKR
jgi:hypothetical protein